MQSTCSVAGCDRPHRANSYCGMHNARWRRTGDPGPAGSLYDPERGCSVESCDEYHQAKGYCQEHYKRWRAQGDPLAEPKQRKRRRPRRDCSAEDCARLDWAAGLCQKHYMRMRRRGSIADVDQRKQFGRICSIADCGQPHQAQGLCVKHYSRLRLAGDPFMDRPTGVNYAPKVLKPPKTWMAMHHRLRNHHGKASEFPCSRCGGKARDWAYDHADPNEIRDADGKVFSIDPDRYLPMCPSCHRTFDRLHIAEQANRESTVVRMQREVIDRLTARVSELEQQNALLRRGLTA